MKEICFQKRQYEIILKIICDFFSIERTEIKNALKRKETRYMLLLLLKNFSCCDFKIIKDELSINSVLLIRNNLKKAQEKLFVNRDFRERYFRLEEMTRKIIWKNYGNKEINMIVYSVCLLHGYSILFCRVISIV